MLYKYCIADIVVSSDRDIAAQGVRGFAPFAIEDASAVSDTHIHFVEESHFEEDKIGIISKSFVSEANADGEFARTKRGYLYTIKGGDNTSSTYVHIDATTLEITTNSAPQNSLDVALLRFGLWMMFGVVLAQRGAIAVHSSVIECRGRGILFLGESGTGKSTHTRLWREHIEGATLLNDDSPIVRIVDGEARVYGSPWSGKTPCYKSRYVPIAGFCRLSQAPHNAIRRLPTIAAIGALLPSCPPQYAHDEPLQDAICRTLSEMLRRVPAYHLECLPDAAAARVSHDTILGDE
jgi:hypothetical protein